MHATALTFLARASIYILVGVSVPAHAQNDADPLSLDIVYTGDVLVASSGGVSKGGRYLDNLDIVANADLDQLMGWKGATASAYVLYNNGTSISSLAGDDQAISNLETGVRAVRLYEAWIEQKIGGSASIRAGLYDLNSEFDVLESSSLFTGSAHGIGTDISQSGLNGPSIFPATSLSVRLDLALGSNWKLRAAVLDGAPGDLNQPSRTAVKLSDGALLIAEIEAPLPNGKLLLGHWRYTDSFDQYDGARGQGNQGFYLRGESRLIKENGSAVQGLSGFFRLGLADNRFNKFSRFATAGIVYTGAIKGRDSDSIGLAVASAFVGDAFRATARSTKAETAFELTYRARLAPWLQLQPLVHYVINPGTSPDLRDSLVFGIRFETSIPL
jgi:porin